MHFLAQTMDLNHDGEVTVDEFVHYCRSQQGIRESMTVSGAGRALCMQHRPSCLVSYKAPLSGPPRSGGP